MCCKETVTVHVGNSALEKSLVWGDSQTKSLKESLGGTRGFMLAGFPIEMMDVSPTRV